MGDGFLIEFASVVAAVRTAIAIQTDMGERGASEPEARRLRLRMGINVGDIVIDGDDILGDGVNIAARLEPLAPAGEICISRAVYEQVRGKVDAELMPMGAKQLKNIPIWWRSGTSRSMMRLPPRPHRRRRYRKSRRSPFCPSTI